MSFPVLWFEFPCHLFSVLFWRFPPAVCVLSCFTLAALVPLPVVWLSALPWLVSPSSPCVFKSMCSPVLLPALSQLFLYFMPYSFLDFFFFFSFSVVLGLCLCPLDSICSFEASTCFWPSPISFVFVLQITEHNLFCCQCMPLGSTMFNQAHKPLQYWSITITILLFIDITVIKPKLCKLHAKWWCIHLWNILEILLMQTSNNQFNQVH